MKDTYDFDSKAKAREKLRAFVETVASKRSRRKDMKVLTMSGHEDVEFKQVWDPLGIPRENITVVEGNPQAHDLIRSQNLGINLVDESISMRNFLKSTPNTFDVMNLDYMGVFDLDKRDDITTIVGRGLLGEKGILATWYSGKREHSYAKKTFDIIQAINKRHLMDARNWKESRGDIIASSLEHMFLDGVRDITKIPLLKNDTIFRLCYRHYQKTINEFNEKDLGTQLTEDSWRHCMQISLPYVIADLLDKNRDNLPIEFNGITQYDLSKAICSIEFQSYVSAIHESYRYISDNATPMFVDFNYFKKEEFDKFLRYGVLEDGLFIGLRSRDKDDVKKFKSAIAQNVESYRHNRTLPKRIFLGSSATGSRTGTRKSMLVDSSIQPIEELVKDSTVGGIQESDNNEIYINLETSQAIDVISKEDAMGLLQAGYTPKEIAECYGGFTKMQLAAFKAHMTMGTYDGNSSYRKPGAA